MNVHIPWIKITLNNNVSLTWRSDPSSPDYFTSLTNKRTVEEATEINLNITYCPKVGEDCNRIEKAVVESPFCTIQYGDTYGSRSVTSRVYKGLIYSYSTSFNEGYLSYSFKIVSTSVIYNFVKIEPIRLPLLSSSSSGAIGQAINVIGSAISSVRLVVERIIKTYLNEYYTFDSESTGDTLNYCPPPDSPIVVEDVNPIRAIVELVKKIPPIDDNTVRVVEVDDTVNMYGKGSIRVVEYRKDKVNEQSLSFEWGTKNGTVIDWTPQYDGSVAIFRNVNKGDNVTDINVNTMYDADTGKCVSITYSQASQALVGSLMSTDIYNSVGNTIENMNEFMKLADYPYKATLTVLGEDRYITPAKTKINVTPVIMGVAHHSKGVYAANSITDTVNSQGFTTTYDLYRLTDQGELTNPDSDADNSVGVYVNGTLYNYSDFLDLDLSRG